MPINKTGLFQAGTLSISSTSSVKPLDVPAATTNPLGAIEAKIDLQAWTKNIYDHNHDSHHLEFTNAVIDAPLNGMKPGRYDVFVDFSRGEFVVENRDTNIRHTWPCELRITGPVVQSEIVLDPEFHEPGVVHAPTAQAFEDVVIDDDPQIQGSEGPIEEPDCVGICVSSVGDLLYGCMAEDSEAEPLPPKKQKKEKSPPPEDEESVLIEAEAENKHICKGTGAKPPISLCKNHTECHKKGYELCEPHDISSAFGRTPPAFIDTVQVDPLGRDESLSCCENCEWDGVCSLKFLGNSKHVLLKQPSIWVEDASHNLFHIPRSAVISYEEKKGKEKKRVIKQNLRQKMEEEIESLLIDFSVKESTREKFIISHASQFEDAVNNMYKEYKADGELDDLKNPENDWVREFMGEIFKDIDFENECIRKADGPKKTEKKKKPPSYLEIQYTGDKPKNTIVKDGYKYKLDGTGMDLRTGQRVAFYVRGKKVEK